MRPFALSVKVIVTDSQGRCLVLRRSASSRNHAGKWEFPGGKVDPGETFDVALLREVMEETGLDIELASAFGTCESGLADKQIVYLIMEGTAASADVRLSSEHDDYKWATPTELDDIDFAPQFRIAAQRYQQDVAANP